VRQRRYILDSTLRDGEQSPGVSFTDEQRLRIAALLDDSGVEQIEAGVPASSKLEKDNIIKIMENRRRSIVSVWARLVPSDVEHAIDCRPDMIHISIPVSYVHIYAKLRKNKNWVISQVYACLGLIERCGIPLSVGFEDAFRSDASFIMTLARVLTDFGVTRFRLADTVGVASPSLCREVVGDFMAKLGNNAQLGFHAHNDLGMALANTVEAAKAGCVYADATICGIGERAGNCDLARLVRASSAIFDWGITPDGARTLQDGYLEIVRA
jgi:homocitrate synthase NifV